jgi:hypothetical protein
LDKGEMMKKTITAAMVGAILFLTGCALLPYDSDFACPESKGYGSCMGAKENYELSQMSVSERSKVLNKQGSKEIATTNKESPCENNKSCESECDEDCKERLQTLKKSGCLSPEELLALENHNALIYIERLLLDRQAIKDRTPKEPNNAASKDGLSGAYCPLDNASQSKAESGEVETPNEESENGAIVADALIESVAISAEANGVERKTTDGSKLCGFPQVEKGSTIRIEVDRAWLRTEPNPKYPPDSAIEAKRGDSFVVAEGWQSANCGWLKLDNDRYIHQSIVSVSAKENTNVEEKNTNDVEESENANIVEKNTVEETPNVVDENTLELEEIINEEN